jgi:hypothetical protein
VRSPSACALNARAQKFARSRTTPSRSPAEPWRYHRREATNCWSEETIERSVRRPAATHAITGTRVLTGTGQPLNSDHGNSPSNCPPRLIFGHRRLKSRGTVSTNPSLTTTAVCLSRVSAARREKPGWFAPCRSSFLRFGTAVKVTARLLDALPLAAPRFTGEVQSPNGRASSLLIRDSPGGLTYLSTPLSTIFVQRKPNGLPSVWRHHQPRKIRRRA